MMNNLKNKSNVKCQNTFGCLDQWIHAEGRDCETYVQKMETMKPACEACLAGGYVFPVVMKPEILAF